MNKLNIKQKSNKKRVREKERTSLRVVCSKWNFLDCMIQALRRISEISVVGRKVGIMI